MHDPALEGLAAAVASTPGDAELRIAYARRLVAAGDRNLAVAQLAVALDLAPGHPAGTALWAEVTADSTSQNLPSETPGGDAVEPAPTDEASESSDIDWKRLEQEVGSPVKPPFVATVDAATGMIGVSEVIDNSPILEIERSTITLDDVGGLDQVKKRIQQTFLEPMRHPEIAKAFKKSLRGGLILYGPPGCGKTFMARAIAGELGASFLSVTISDILSKWLGDSEENVHAVFQEARRVQPAVLFFDEVDAVGGKRSHAVHTGGMRNVVNQLLTEMDGVGSDNDGVFVLAATNHPWDVDSALLRPGRFDRMVLVLPPDLPAREAILRYHFSERPIEGIDVALIAARTEGYSGADLQHVCDTAADIALNDSIRLGEVRTIQMADVLTALDEVKSSIGPWLESARNVASYGNSDGRYDDLVDYLKQRRLL
jgi:AAA+ superfamily predicted ATPase